MFRIAIRLNLLLLVAVASTPPTPLPVPSTLEEALVVIAQMAARIEVLEEKLRKSSSNSSKPPSSDGPARKAKQKSKKKRSGRKPGGQPGHVKHEREMVPPEHVDESTEAWPEQCEHCQVQLPKVSADAKVYQQFEIPVIKPLVRQITAHEVNCPGCGLRNRAPTTQEQRCGYGPRVDAVVTTLMGNAAVSKRAAAEIINEMFSVPISAASVVAAQTRASDAMAQPVEEARVAAKTQQVKNADETRTKEKNKYGYMWVVVTSTVVVFVIAMSRARQVAEDLLGAGGERGEGGVLGTDRYSGYLWWHCEWHQFCWAHLKREFVAMSERPGHVGEVGKKLVAEVDQMFAWWAQVKSGELSRQDFELKMLDLEDRVGGLLEEGRANKTDKKTRGLCKNLLNHWSSLWAFVNKDGVEPTNNSAERAVRHWVMWRKRSYGTQSEASSRFVERIMTVRATLRLQGRSVFNYIVEACQAARAGLTAPSLISAKA
jgi:transposase